MEQDKINIQLQGLTARQVRIVNLLWYDCETQEQVDAVLRFYGQEAVDIKKRLLQARYDAMVQLSVNTIKAQEDMEHRVNVSMADARKVLDRILK